MNPQACPLTAAVFLCPLPAVVQLLTTFPNMQQLRIDSHSRGPRWRLQYDQLPLLLQKVNLRDPEPQAAVQHRSACAVHVEGRQALSPPHVKKRDLQLLTLCFPDSAAPSATCTQLPLAVPPQLPHLQSLVVVSSDRARHNQANYLQRLVQSSFIPRMQLAPMFVAQPGSAEAWELNACMLFDRLMDSIGALSGLRSLDLVTPAFKQPDITPLSALTGLTALTMLVSCGQVDWGVLSSPDMLCCRCRSVSNVCSKQLSFCMRAVGCTVALSNAAFEVAPQSTLGMPCRSLLFAILMLFDRCWGPHHARWRRCRTSPSSQSCTCLVPPWPPSGDLGLLA